MVKKQGTQIESDYLTVKQEELLGMKTGTASYPSVWANYPSPEYSRVRDN